jgi:hypothetical protein
MCEKERAMKKMSRGVVAAGAVTALTALTALTVAYALTSMSGLVRRRAREGARKGGHPVRVEVLAPGRGSNAGADGAGWIVDLKIDFPAGDLKRTGFDAFQLTGPGVHNNAAPAPGSFSPGGDDRLPGLLTRRERRPGRGAGPANMPWTARSRLCPSP